MKLTTAIKAAQVGLEKLDAQVAAAEADMKERSKELDRLREEQRAHGDMLNAMWALQGKQKPGETIEFQYSESPAEQRDLIRKICELYTSEQREISNLLKMDVRGEPSIGVVRMIVEAARRQDRFDEIMKVADAYIAAHKR